MTKPKIRIRITGTRTGKLRARVEEDGEHHFEVTIGGEKWKTLKPYLKRKIEVRAHVYLGVLTQELIAISNSERHWCDHCDADHDARCPARLI